MLGLVKYTNAGPSPFTSQVDALLGKLLDDPLNQDDAVATKVSGCLSAPLHILEKQIPVQMSVCA